MPNYFFNSLPHFPGGLIGKGKRHDAERIYSFTLDQVCDAVCQHAGFAGTSSGNQHTGTFGI
jgi:hypothetical protein